LAVGFRAGEFRQGSSVPVDDEEKDVIEEDEEDVAVRICSAGLLDLRLVGRDDEVEAVLDAARAHSRCPSRRR
jgi:hypothetical protein